MLSPFLFTYAPNFIPLAAAVMLTYLSPIFVTLMAPLMPGETIGRHQWLAVIIALRDLITRQHIGGEHVLALSVIVQVMSVAAAGFAFYRGWLAPRPRQLALHALCGVIVAAGAAGFPRMGG